MEVKDWMVVVLLIVFVVLITVLVSVTLIDISNDAVYNRAKRKYNKAMESILVSYHNNKDYEQCIFELDLVFKNIILKNERLEKEINNISNAIEKYILSVNIDGTEIPVNDVDVYKQTLRELLKKYEMQNPMAQLEGAEFIILKEILQCVEKGDVDKSNELVNELAVEIKALQDNNLEHVKNSKKQDLMTKVGLVLTFVFGIMTFVQFFV